MSVCLSVTLQNTHFPVSWRALVWPEMNHFSKICTFFSHRFLKRPVLNPHFLVLRRALVEERSPNMGLWLQKMHLFFPRIINMFGFRPHLKTKDCPEKLNKNLNTFIMDTPCIYLKSLLDNRVYILQCLSVCPFFSRNGHTITKRMMMMTTRTTTMRTTALMTTTTKMETIKEIGLGDLQKRR